MAKSLSDHGMEIINSFADIAPIDPAKLNRDLTKKAMASASDELVDQTVPTPWERRRMEMLKADGATENTADQDISDDEADSVIGDPGVLRTDEARAAVQRVFDKGFAGEGRSEERNNA